MSIELPSPTEFIKIASKTARHFGFDSLDELKAKRSKLEPRKTAPARIAVADRKIDNLHGFLTSGISEYFENNLHSSARPALFQ